MASPPNVQAGDPSSALASVVTQVSPAGSYPGNPRSGGPARPIRIPRQRAPEQNIQYGSPVSYQGVAQTVPQTSQDGLLAGLGPVSPPDPKDVPSVSVTAPANQASLPSSGLEESSHRVLEKAPEATSTTRPRGQRPVSAPVPPAVREVAPSPKPASAPPAPVEERPRGLKRFFAMMRCSGSATHAAAMSDLPPSGPALPASRTNNEETGAEKDVSTVEPSAVRRTSAPRPKSAPAMPGVFQGGAPSMSRSETLGVANGDVVQSEIGLPTVENSTLPDGDITEQTEDAPDAFSFGYMQELLSEQDMYLEEQQLIQQGGTGIPLDENNVPRPLLAPKLTIDKPRKCLVLDLDETLVHSSFKLVPNADFVVNVEIDGAMHNVYVIKRPGVDEFLRLMGLLYEVVVFTASLNKYADPVLDILDVHDSVRHRLFRESCYNHHGNYVKDLSQLGRPLCDTIIMDNSPASYIFHPANAVPVSSWFNDPHDTELTDVCPFLEDLSHVQDVRVVLDNFYERT